MSSLTSHNKRGNNGYILNLYFLGKCTINSTYPFVHSRYYDNQLHTHVSKKQKTESLVNNHHQSTSSSSNFMIKNIYSRISGMFSRSISNGNRVLENEELGKNMSHYGGQNLGLAGVESLFDEKVEELFTRYERKKKCAIKTIRHVKKDERVGSVTEVIDLDKEDDDDDDEVEIVENGSMDSELENAGKVLETLVLDSDDDGVVHKNLSREPFVPLTNEEEDEVYQAFSVHNRRKVLVTHENSNIDITVEVLQCLMLEEWLNDEVINVYFHLLKERENRDPKKFLKCHFFNTFFYKKLIGGKSGYDYKSVRKWTTPKKLGYNLSECDIIFVPIHKQAHWCLAVINRKDQKFQYLDSLGGVDTYVLRVLAMYFVDELKDKNELDIDVDSWTQEHVKDIPLQKNGSDCGMFMIKYADFYSRGLGLSFNQEHMQYFRLRTAKEILKLEAR